jgi:hypothetical protein
LLVAAGASPTTHKSTVLNGGTEHGVLTMESYVFGEKIALDLEFKR